MSNSDPDYPRTLYEARLDVEYDVRLQELHVRLYRRIRVGLTLMTLISGCTSFSTLFGSDAKVAGYAAAFITCAAFIDTAFDLGGRIAAHDAYRKALIRLLIKPGVSLEQLDAKILRLRIEDPGNIEGLRVVAYNDSLRSNGRYEHIQKLTAYQTVLNWIA